MFVPFTFLVTVLNLGVFFKVRYKYVVFNK